MIYQSTSKFRFIDRNYNKTLVLIPGWATDYRIFYFLDMSYNYIFPLDFYPEKFKEDLSEYLKSQNIKRLSILGFSLGGFIAEEFASGYSDGIDKLFLAGVRKKYKTHEIEHTIMSLKKNRLGFLCSFYSACISKKQQGYFWKTLFKTYYDVFDLQFLIRTLLYLGEREIKNENLRNIKKIILIHGEQDRIAPINESIQIKNSLQNAEIKIIKNTGHFPFLEENRTLFYE